MGSIRVADRGGLCLRHRAEGRALDELRLSGSVVQQRRAPLHASGQSGDPFKLTRTTLTKIGTTDLAQRISFLPRNIAPKST